MAYIIIMMFALHNLLAGWLGETTLPSILYSAFASVLRNVYISWLSDEPRQPQAYVINSGDINLSIHDGCTLWGSQLVITHQGEKMEMINATI